MRNSNCKGRSGQQEGHPWRPVRSSHSLQLFIGLRDDGVDLIERTLERRPGSSQMIELEGSRAAGYQGQELVRDGS
ncbi:MAG: hypothetical protein M5U01_36080 [Ardenticatenaceae bacterium]|nr:hypothetical protein [Ardenticatenaceae bacterium]